MVCCFRTFSDIVSQVMTAEVDCPPNGVQKELLDVDRELLSMLTSKLEQAEWVQSHLDGVSTLQKVEKDLRDIRIAFWNSLVASRKVNITPGLTP